MVNFTSDHHLKEMITWHSPGNSMRKTLSTLISENLINQSVQTLDQNYRFLMNFMKTFKKLWRDTLLHAIVQFVKFFNIQNSWNALEMKISRRLLIKRKLKTMPEFLIGSPSPKSILNTSSWAMFQRKSWYESSSKLSHEVTFSITNITIHSRTWSIGSSKSSDPEITNGMLERPNHHNRLLVDRRLRPEPMRIQATWQCVVEAWISNKTAAGKVAATNKRMVSFSFINNFNH